MSWFQLQKNMNVVNIGFNSSNYTVLLCGNLNNYLFYSIADFRYQNASAVFYAPYKMIVQSVSAMCRIACKLFHNIGLLYHKTCIFVTLRRRFNARLSGERFIPDLKMRGLLVRLVKQIDIAKLFNVSPTNIRAIHRGLTWGYLA